MKKLAFVFPGQGSQSIAMLSALAHAYPAVQETFEVASAVLGYDLWALTQAGPLEKLNQTEFTQPALLAAGVAAWRVYQAQAGAKTPDYLAGHSLGEYTAWVCAGSLKFEDGIKLVSERGKAMQAAVPAGTGAMAAIIGLDNDAVAKLCETAAQSQVCSPANFNSVGQVVIAGDKVAVERAVAAAKPAGAKLAKLIPVSVPSHCALMASAAKALRPILDSIDFKAPEMPVINNVAVAMPHAAVDIRLGLEKQLTQSVRWVETVQYMLKAGVSQIVECGPGKVLTGLNKRIDRDLILTAYSDPASLAACLKI